MNYRHTLYWIKVLIIVLTANLSHGQTTTSYTNSWINYSQPYVKVLVNTKGIHKLPFSVLPAGFPISQPAKLQIWRYGKQVAISIINNEIYFYGTPNEGARDSLLYRPYSSRMNPYFSLFSDEAAYFLTVSDSKSIRIETVSKAVSNAVPALAYHSNKDVALFKTDYSLSTRNPVRPHFFNSYYEHGASGTGPAIVKNKLATYPIQLTGAVNVSAVKPRVKLLIHGRSNNQRSVEIYFGKTEQALRLVTKLANKDFEGSEFEFDLLPGDLDASNKGVLSLKSENSEQYERFSLAYFTVTYPQTLSMQSKKSYEFSLDAGKEAVSRINLAGVAANSAVYDITDTLKIISGDPANLMVPRKPGKALKLFVSGEVINIAATRLSTVNFKPYEPEKANFIMVTSESLLTSAQTYADYRASAEGGRHKVLLADIRDLYNQFNYGEPSPLGIRQFVDFMLSDGNKNKYLFLVGRSITFLERMKRELPDEVPTIGFPGSDVLLVAGLAGASQDNSAIPVGRLAAMNKDNVLAYLQKVKDYEHAKVDDLGWRKRVLHINGGKSASEITQLKNLLESLRPTVENGIVGGELRAFVKQQAMAEKEEVNITPEVNDGVGMITYFGHGGADVTDLDIGYITEVARGYNNVGKYPFMYFNGCSVGNVFSARYNMSPSAGSDRVPLSLDWMISPNRGAIAFIANSFEGFVSPLTTYLNGLYEGMFKDEATSNQAIGRIQMSTASKIIQAGASGYDIANIHQSLLQGDPSLRLVSVANPDYTIDADEGVFLQSESKNQSIENSINLTTSVIFSNAGKYIKDQKIPIVFKYEYKDGSELVFKESVAAVPNVDTLVFVRPNKKNLVRLTVKVDPDSTLTELSRSNNTSELIVDWEVAKRQSLYPSEPIKDLIAPVMVVTLDTRYIRNMDQVSSNPLIEVDLQDDRLLTKDSLMVNIFLKSCEDNSCDFIRVNYKNAIEILSTSDRSLRFTFQSAELKPGIYELLVNAQDASKNFVVTPYRITFRIPETDIQKSVFTVSPNPASDFVRFALQTLGKQDFQSVDWKIFSADGKLLDFGTQEMGKTGLKDWYWFPKATINSGVYIYQLKLSGSNISEKVISGRVALSR
ncbi:putative type IX secretion system sortase PorU2 [Dyadobacter arcticus]|uniref:Gingipain domain-containing protein n=1 Tax=Dyadobacter arcticus TaxID=1078754 RepID=A0ABX0UIJ2_9BACT|nr:C25 family cysteine peptidase [Dyadobacter arcticus]NIJ51505.1 hypothetical protein [Dyadobacter arcticus]